MEKGDWETMYKSWKTERERENMPRKLETEKIEAKVGEIKKNIIRDADFIERKVSSLTNASWNKFTAPKHIRFFKIIIFIIPILIFGYLLYNNFIASKEFEYFYDIGSKNDNYLTPLTRVSEVIKTEDLNYRNLTSGLVYFNVPIARGANKVNVQVRFKDNFPENARFSFGAKDQEEWHYKWNQMYSSSFSDLGKFERKGDVYRIKGAELLDENEVRDKEGVIIATDKPFNAVINKVEDYNKEESVINHSLRGGHTFYIYAEGNLELKVKKQDLNWYNGTDETHISLYDSDNNLINESLIEDDGIEKVNKGKAKIQEGDFKINGLKEGVYRLEFSSFDGLIREIKINTNKIVADSLFLADNELYNLDKKEVNIYFKSKNDIQLRLLTYHSAGLQSGSYSVDEAIRSFNIDKINGPVYIDLTEGEYKIKFPENDVIVSGAGYFAFDKKNYFEPFKQRVLSIKNDWEWIKNNVDYLIIDYNPPKEDGNWLIAEKEFNIKEENLYVKDNKLSMVFSVPHLGQEENIDKVIPIDWIKIKTFKEGFVK